MITKQVLDALKELKEAIDRQSELLNRMWATYEHRCPKCGRTIVNFDEWQFIESIGECFSCDHVRGNVQDEQKGNHDIFE